MKMVDKSSKLDKYSANMNASTSAAAAAAGTGIGGGSGAITGTGSAGLVGSSGIGSNVTGYYYQAMQQQQQHHSSSSSGHQQQHHQHQNGQKPVPMKLFAAWEVDRTPPNCIPR